MDNSGDAATDALARRLLAQIACFAPGELIPRDLLLLTMMEEQAEGENEDDALDAALQVGDALYRLMALGLVEVEAVGQILLHRLLALFIQTIDRESYAAAARVVDATLLRKADRLNNSGIPQPLLCWQVHLRHRTDITKDQRDESAAELCNTFGIHLHMIGELAATKPYLEQALAIWQTVLGDQNPDTATSLNNLGGLLQAMGNLAEAKAYYERALAIRQEVLGDQHPDTARSLNNLGAVLRSMGELAAARSYYEHALAIFEKRLGAAHPSTEIVRKNLARLAAQMQSDT